MAWYTTLSIGFTLLIAMTFSGLPLFVGFLLLNAIGVSIFFGASAFGMFANSLIDTLTSESLIAVPLFLLMGEFLFRSSAIDELYSALDTIIGRVRIKLYAVTVALATILGTMSGSAMADAAIMARTLYPGMVARGYDPRMSAGLIMSGATLAPIIPPSILAVVLATLTNVSIADLLISGILPGLLLASLLLFYVWVRVLIDPSKAPMLTDLDRSPSVGDRVRAVSRILPFGGVIFMVIGLMMLGIASPTEAAATGVFATILVAAYLRTLSMKMIGEALFSATRTGSVIFVILMSANLFGQLLAYTGAPDGMVGLVKELKLEPWKVFITLMFISFVACMFLGQTEYMLISVPIFLPIVKAAGFEPVWFWMLYLVNITIGGMTPPFGMTMFVFKASADMSMAEVYNSTWPFVAVLFFGIAIMCVFPQIVTVLPLMTR
jgi:tripartite ATP-independent transporter DctM subunit